MTSNPETGVLGAFEKLSDEIESEIDLVSQLIKTATERRDFDRGQELSARAAAIQAFQHRLSTFHEEWLELSIDPKDEEQQIATERRHLGRIKSGQLTRYFEFYDAILQYLQSNGGTGTAAAIAEAAELAMRDQLNDVDYEPKPSDPNMPRWRNSVYWAGTYMRKEGLLEKVVKRGTWVMTDKGRQYLAEQGG